MSTNYQERERILVDAAERYLRGEIDLDEHNRIRDEHRTDYLSAARAIGRARIQHRRWWNTPAARIAGGLVVGFLGTQLAIRLILWVTGS